MKSIKLKLLSDLPHVAAQILEEAKGQRLVLFFAEMGMGKTTLIKELCKQLGVKEVVSSPTFSIVNEYQGKDNTIYHFDFYRLDDEEEAYDLGYEEYFYSKAYCFVEWPEKIKNLLPEDALEVHIEWDEEEERVIRMHKSTKK